MQLISNMKEFQKENLKGLIDETLEQVQATEVDRFFGSDVAYTNDFVYDVVKSNQYLAPVIQYGAEPPVVDNGAIAKISGEVAKIGYKAILTERDLLKIMHSRHDAELKSILDKILVDIAKMVIGAERRFQMLRYEAVTTGAISYQENGIKFAVDFGVPAENKFTVTKVWSDITSDPIADLLEWQDKYIELNGARPDAILMSRVAYANLVKNQRIIIEAGRPEGSARVSNADLDNVLAMFGLAPIHVIEASKITYRANYSDNDVTKTIYPDDLVVFISEGLGNFVQGVTVENEGMPGIVANVFDNAEQLTSTIRVVGAGLPVILNPHLLFHCTVL